MIKKPLIGEDIETSLGVLMAWSDPEFEEERKRELGNEWDVMEEVLKESVELKEKNKELEKINARFREVLFKSHEENYHLKEERKHRQEIFENQLEYIHELEEKIKNFGLKQ